MFLYGWGGGTFCCFFPTMLCNAFIIILLFRVKAPNNGGLLRHWCPASRCYRFLRKKSNISRHEQDKNQTAAVDSAQILTKTNKIDHSPWVLWSLCFLSVKELISKYLCCFTQHLMVQGQNIFLICCYATNHPKHSGCLEQVCFVLQQSEINIEKQHSLHISWTDSQRAAGLLQLRAFKSTTKTSNAC